MNLVSNYLEKNILSNTAKINGIQSITSLKLRIKIVAFFLGHPVLHSSLNCMIDNATKTAFYYFWVHVIKTCVLVVPDHHICGLCEE